MQTHFLLVFLLSPPSPTPPKPFRSPKGQLHPHDHLAADHAQISRYSLFSNAIIETSTTTSDNFSAGVSQTTPHDGCSDKTGRTTRTNRDMKIFTGLKFSYGISTFLISENIIAHPCFRALQALRKRKMPNLPKNHPRKETRHPPIDSIAPTFHQPQSENISKQLAIQTQTTSFAWFIVVPFYNPPFAVIDAKSTALTSPGTLLRNQENKIASLGLLGFQQVCFELFHVV